MFPHIHLIAEGTQWNMLIMVDSAKQNTANVSLNYTSIATTNCDPSTSALPKISF